MGWQEDARGIQVCESLAVHTEIPSKPLLWKTWLPVPHSLRGTSTGTFYPGEELAVLTVPSLPRQAPCGTPHIISNAEPLTCY